MSDARSGPMPTSAVPTDRLAGIATGSALTEAGSPTLAATTSRADRGASVASVVESMTDRVAGFGAPAALPAGHGTAALRSGARRDAGAVTGPRTLRARAVDLVALVKPRIMMMALLTAAGAMSLAPGDVPPARALWLILGTALIVGSANTLNMWLERDIDCLMARTRNRPLPQHRLAASTALGFGAVQGALSLPVLANVNLLTAGLGLVALLLYVGVYTPMKQRSHWATWVGAVPGALPALMGWTAATGRIQLAGLAVFGVLFFWQIPHFHAIAMYRQRDYDAAGLKTLPGTHGIAAARHHIVFYLVVQVAVSLSLVPLGVAGVPYLVTAALLGVLVLVQGTSGLRAGTQKWARSVFLTSILYLPVLFAVMVLDGKS